MSRSALTLSPELEPEPILPIGVSIVLYRTPVAKIEPLLQEFLQQGAARIYLIDNSPLSFDPFEGWQPHERITTIRLGKNLGYGRANNIAIRDSILRHQYHVISNPDIRLQSHALSNLLALLESRPEIGLAMPQIIGPDGARHYLCKRAPSPVDFVPQSLVPQAWRGRRRAHYEMRDCSYDDQLEVECLSGCFMFARSSVLQAIGGFDERFFMYMEDFDLSRRARRVARNLYHPNATVIHEHARGHRHSLRLLWAFGVSLVRYFSKWGWFEGRESRRGAGAKKR